MSGPGVIAGDQLRTIVERIEQVENEIKELTEAIIFIRGMEKSFRLSFYEDIATIK